MTINLQKKSIKIPDKVVGQLQYLSNLQCCVCQSKGEHIHHLNSNKYDHRIDNLAYLCFQHHDDATKTGGLSRKLTKETIINYRDHHYKVIEKSRQLDLCKFDKPVNNLTEETLLTSCKNALIIIELEKIKEKYYSANWHDRLIILNQLNKFSSHSNNRLTLEVLDFLTIISGQTRGGMTSDIAASVFEIVVGFFPSFQDNESVSQSIQLAKTSIYIGYNIAYDSLIHFRNIAVSMWGLTIIKLIYRTAKENNITELISHINKTYDDLESTLKRPERNDLSDAQELTRIFRDDLDIWDLSFPILTPNLMNRFNIEERK